MGTEPQVHALKKSRWGGISKTFEKLQKKNTPNAPPVTALKVRDDEFMFAIREII